MTQATAPQIKLVWAKVKGYPWWPATINMRNEYSEQSKDRLVVNFLGENSHAEVKSDMVQDFTKHYQQHRHMKNKKLLNAIKIALDIADELFKSGTGIFEETQTLVDSKKQPSKHDEDSSKAVEEPPANFIDRQQLPKTQSHNQPQQQPQFTEHHETSLSEAAQINIRKARSATIERPINRIPLRKFEQITLEGRIVELLNNLKQGKDCTNDLYRIFKRLVKIKNKDAMNRFVLSGLITTHKLVGLSNMQEKEALLAELLIHIDTIKNRCCDIMQDTKAIERELLPEQDNSNEEEPNSPVPLRNKKKQVVRTIHHIIRVKFAEVDIRRCRMLSIQIYESWQRVMGRFPDCDNHFEIISLGSILNKLKRMSPEELQSPDSIDRLMQCLPSDTIVR